MSPVHPPIPEETNKELEEYSELLRHLLFHRGVKTREEAEKFLRPKYEDNHDPFLMPGMEKAVERFLKAIDSNEHIVVYSDYDADGIPGAVLFASFLKKIGYLNYSHYVPDRHEEGFGVNIDAINEIVARRDALRADKSSGTTEIFMITIDCGISDVIPLKKAYESKIDVVVTDHHLPGLELPKAYAIVNPKVEEKVGKKKMVYPFDMLCGSGVIFKFVQGVLAKRSFEEKGMKAGQEKWLLDMVGIATLSDMVPLVGENRIFAHYGLAVLRKSPRIGLRKLLAKQRINQGTLSEDDIGFTISPRINAASRMGKAEFALNLFLADDEIEADRLATILQKLNDERKGVVASIVKQLHKELEEEAISKDLAEYSRPVIVRGNPLWRPSLMGLAANSMVERYRCPVFLWGRGEEFDITSEGNIKGSCRSDGTVSVVEVMRKAEVIAKEELGKELFLHAGGHAMSGGFAVTHEHVHIIPEYLEKAVVAIGRVDRFQALTADLVLTLDEVDQRLFVELSKLGPFGEGNQKPLFLFKDIVPKDLKQFGKNKEHFQMSFAKSRGGVLNAISFFTRPIDFQTEPVGGRPLSMLAHVEHSSFMGRSEIRLRVVEVM